MGLYEDRIARIEAAVALEPVDKIPLVSGAAAFAATACDVKLSDFIEDPELNCTTNIKCTELMGEVDGVQTALSTPDQLPGLWLSKIKSPGRELPDDELWQVCEDELIEQEDYDRILEEGFGPWLQRFTAENLADPNSKFDEFMAYMSTAVQRFADAGYPIVNGGVTMGPFEMLCGGRSLMAMLMDDLMEIPDKVDEVFKLVHEFNMASYEGLFASSGKPWGVWVGGWRGSLGMLSREMFERFSWPYMVDCVSLCIDYGVVPILHLDGNWDRALGHFKQLPAKKAIMALDSQTDIRLAKEMVGDRMCIMGDVPAELLAFNKPQDTYDYVSALIEDVGPTGYICCSGCDIPYNAKVENVQMMSKAITDLP